MKKILFFSLCAALGFDSTSGMEIGRLLNSSSEKISHFASCIDPMNASAAFSVDDNKDTQANVMSIQAEVLATFANHCLLCRYKNHIVQEGRLCTNKSTYILVKKASTQSPSDDKVTDQHLIQSFPPDIGRVFATLCLFRGGITAPDIASRILKRSVTPAETESLHVKSILDNDLPPLLTNTGIKVFSQRIKTRRTKYRVRVKENPKKPITWGKTSSKATVDIPVTKVTDINVGSTHLSLYRYKNMNNMSLTGTVTLSCKETYFLMENEVVSTLSPLTGVVLCGFVNTLKAESAKTTVTRIKKWLNEKKKIELSDAQISKALKQLGYLLKDWYGIEFTTSRAGHGLQKIESFGTDTSEEAISYDIPLIEKIDYLDQFLSGTYYLPFTAVEDELTQSSPSTENETSSIGNLLNNESDDSKWDDIAEWPAKKRQRIESDAFSESIIKLLQEDEKMK